MNDMSSVIVPKSDQINADDLIGRDMTITIREVQIKGGQEQPVSIYFDGSDKAFRPCKGMSRVLVQAWGPDASKYVGRSLTLYRDPKVKWGGLEVGGIRIRAMSHIDKPMTMAIAESRAVRKPITVQRLDVEQQSQGKDEAREWADKFITNVGRAPDAAKLESYFAGKAVLFGELADTRPELHEECNAALAAKRASFATVDDDDPFAEPDEPASDWLAKAQELRGGIRNAKNATYLAAVRESYRAVCTAMPKALADEIEALLLAKDAELGEGAGG